MSRRQCDTDAGPDRVYTPVTVPAPRKGDRMYDYANSISYAYDGSIWVRQKPAGHEWVIYDEVDDVQKTV
jgi:hypothetical protein